MSELVWEDPPSATGARTGGGAVKYLDEARELRENPGVWARIEVRDAGEDATSLRSKASYIKTARLSAFRPAGAFEASVRKLDTGGHGLYARFVGVDE